MSEGRIAAGAGGPAAAGMVAGTAEGGSTRPVLRPMALDDLDAVMAIEVSAYPYPWSRGNFIDTLAAGHDARVLEAPDGSLIGYLVALHGGPETHLLNLTVAPTRQRQGHARHLLDDLLARAADGGAAQVWLEVRASNRRARTVYERRGFKTVGLRRHYYPSGGGRREDAVLMSFSVPQATTVTAPGGESP